MYMTHSKAAAFSIALVVTVMFSSLQGCSGTKQTAKASTTYEGEPTTIGGGQARAFITIDDEGRPNAIGVRLDEAALTNLPTAHPYDTPGVEYQVDLPKEAAFTGYDHVTVNWVPMGHIKPGDDESPHFDFHFYVISPAARYQITKEGADRTRAQTQPAAEFMPEGYTLPDGSEELRMGIKAIYPNGTGDGHRPFTKTFVYGFYDGWMIFVEPLVSKDFLEMKTNSTDDIDTPEGYWLHAYYPTKYHVSFDPVKKEHVVALEGLVDR